VSFASLEVLQAAGALTAGAAAFVRDQAVATAAHPLDLLVRTGMMREPDLLRALARAYGTRFVSSERLAKVELAGRILGVLAADAAEAHCALPLVLERDPGLLTVVMADPSQVGQLDAYPHVGKMERVVALVGLPMAIRAALRKHYRGDLHAFERLVAASPQGTCPGCGAPTAPGQVRCGECGLLLEGVEPEATRVAEPSLVRAFLSQSTSGLHQVPGPERLEPTDPGHGPMVTGQSIVRLCAGLDVVVRPLYEFEAYLCAFLDGTSPLREVARAAELAEVEALAMVASLLERGIVELPEPPQLGDEVPTDPGQVFEPTPSGPTQTLQPTKVARSPQRPEPLLQQVSLLEQQGRIDDAVRLLEEGIAQTRRPAPLYNHLALVLLRERGERATAEEMLRRAMTLEPAVDVYRENLAKVYAQAVVPERPGSPPPRKPGRGRR
jgi:hypothetical protein